MADPYGRSGGGSLYDTVRDEHEIVLGSKKVLLYGWDGFNFNRITIDSNGNVHNVQMTQDGTMVLSTPSMSTYSTTFGANDSGLATWSVDHMLDNPSGQTFVMTTCDPGQKQTYETLAIGMYYYDNALGGMQRVESGSPLPIVSAPSVDAVFQPEITKVGSTLTGSFVSIGTLTAGTKKLNWRNSCNQTIQLSYDGANVHMTLERGVAAGAEDFGANGLKTGAQIYLRHAGVVPTGGTFYASGTS